MRGALNGHSRLKLGMDSGCRYGQRVQSGVRRWQAMMIVLLALLPLFIAENGHASSTGETRAGGVERGAGDIGGASEAGTADQQPPPEGLFRRLQRWLGLAPE